MKHVVLAVVAALGAVALHTATSAALARRGQDPPTATATPSPPPTATLALPDLTILFASWAADPAVPVCLQYGPSARWLTTVRVANRGAADAGPFAVAAANLRWDVDGLGAGRTRDLVGPRNVYPRWPIVIDPDNVVRESDESNNAYGPDPDRTWTPTPAATQPPTCTPTPTATPRPPRLLLPWAGHSNLGPPPPLPYAWARPAPARHR